MKKIFLIFILSFFITNISFSSYVVTKKTLGVDLKKPLTKTTTLVNTGIKPTRIMVTFEKPLWAKEDFYLGNDLIAYPRMVVIPPKGKVIIKIAPRIKTQLKDGEYSAILMFKEMPIKNITNGVSILQNIGIPYYGRYGKLTKKIELDKVSLDEINHSKKLTGTISNLGNHSYYIIGNLYDKFNGKILFTFKKPLYRGTNLNLDEGISEKIDREVILKITTTTGEVLNEKILNL